MIKFDEKAHSYTFNGLPVPCVTNILKTVLGDHPAAIRATDYHLQRGRAAHAVYAILGSLAMKGHTAKTIRKEAIDKWNIVSELHPYLDGWLKWYSLFQGEIVGCEVRVYSKIFRYAGTLDLTIKDGPNSKLIVDFKQSSSGRDTYQMGGYALAYNEHESEKINGIMAVQIKGDGNFKMNTKLTGPKFRAAISGWQSVLAVYRMKERGS